MKSGMTNVDVAALATELDHLLAGARLEKAYQVEKDAVLIRFRKKGLGRLDLLFKLGQFVTLTKRAIQTPDTPSMVAKILRQTFTNARVTAVTQIGFDRLMRIDLEKQEDHSIVLELFGDGNLLILDTDDTIILPMRGGDYGARSLRKGATYQPPPGGAMPFQMDPAELQEASQVAKKDLVRFLALDLGFGPLWAEEICLRADVHKARKPQELEAADWQDLHAVIHGLGQDIERNDLAPALVYDEGELSDAVPFTLQKYPQPRFQYEEANTFREALDAFFVGGDEEEDDDDPRRKRYDEAKGKLDRQLQQMQDAIAGFQEEEEARRMDGDTLYARFQEVQKILDDLNAARQQRSWQEVDAILQKARDEGNPLAQVVRQIQPHNGSATLRLETLDGQTRDVQVDLRKSVQENADDQYSAAKKAKSRQDGAGKAVQDVQEKIAALEKKGLDGFGAAPQKARREERHFWFERFRYTLTPNGLVAVGGRSAAQNDQVVKKYLRDGDRYAHAEIHGAPSVVLRPADGPPVEPEDVDLRQACQFAACSSRAWRQFGQGSAYWVTAQQVNKTPRSGEFVPKGAWIVHGRRNVISGLPMAWAIGRVRFKFSGEPLKPDEEAERAADKIVGGPPEGLRPWATDLVVLEPGDVEPNEAATLLAERLGVDIEEIQAVLPPGGVSL